MKRIATLVAAIALAFHHAPAITIGSSVYSGLRAIQSISPCGQTFIAQAPWLQSLGFRFAPINGDKPIAPITIWLEDAIPSHSTVLFLKTINLPSGFDGIWEIDLSDLGIMLEVGRSHFAYLTTETSYWGVGFREFPDKDEYTQGMGIFNGQWQMTTDLVFTATFTEKDVRPVPDSGPTGALALTAFLGLLVLLRASKHRR